MVAAPNGAEVDGCGNWRGVKEEAIEVYKLAQLEAIGEYEISVAVGEGDVGGVEGIGKLHVKSVVRPERVRGGERGNDSDDLEEGAAVVAGDFGGGVHRLEEFEEDSRG